MRKVLIPILIMIFLVGCGKNEPAVNTNQEPTAPAVSTQPQSVQRNPILKPADSKQSDETEPTLSEDLPQTTTPVKTPVQETVPSQPTAPPSTNPQPTEPAPTETKPPEQPEEEIAPPAIEPEPTRPTVPEVTEPTPTEPVPTEPVPTEPTPTEPTPTEPTPEVIDTAALEAYGRSYASSAYGYNGTSACGPGSGAGYFPGATKEILTMADGYSLVCRAIDAQYARDIASGYAPYEEIDGVTVRCPINVRVEPTGQANMYVIWVYYGGA